MGSHLITVKQTQMILINTTMVVPQHKFIQNKGFQVAYLFQEMFRYKKSWDRWC